MNLRIRAMGFAAGSVIGLAVLLSSLYSLWFGSGGTIGYMEWVLPGFERSYMGTIVGTIGGFVWGFVVGVLLAWLYNTFQMFMYKSENPEGVAGPAKR
jgi:hypothetical protein